MEHHLGFGARPFYEYVSGENSGKTEAGTHQDRETGSRPGRDETLTLRRHQMSIEQTIGRDLFHSLEIAIQSAAKSEDMKVLMRII